MPTKIHQYRGGAREQERRRRRELYITKGVTAQAPFLGYCPDLPINIGGWRIARDALNVVPISRQRRGQFLSHEDGYILANDNAVIADGATTGTYTKFALLGGAITGLGSFTTAAGSPTTSTQNMAIYDALLGSVGIHRRVGSGGWTAVDPDNNAPSISTSDSDTRFDTAVYAFGAPTRTYTDTADTGGGPPVNHSGITVPVYIMAGGDATGPTIPVLINPNSDGDYSEFSELWESAFVSDLTIPNPLAHPFMAKSVETWDGRVLYFNTKEGGVHYPGRLRGSAIGTCDPSNEEIGSFRVDFKGYEKQGMRVETIGDQVACYFEDGVVFVQRTGRFTDPVRWRKVSETRGLLSTHALTPISNSQHFGVFSDGWWLVDAGGRWTPVGTIEVSESGDKDTIYYKWRETFRILLDIENKHYVTTSYDPIRRRVRVSFPVRGQVRANGSPLLETWVYDVDTDTVWPLGHDIDVTIWSSFDQLIKSAETYGDYPTTAYGDVTVSRKQYGDYNALFGLAHPSHGDNLNCVYTWDPDIFTRDYPFIEDGSLAAVFERVTPSAYYHTHGISVTENPNERQVLRRVDVEYLNLEGPGVDITAVNNSDVGVTTSVPANEGALGQIHTGHGTYQHGGTHHELQFSMRAPFAVRSFRPAFTKSDNEGTVSSG